MECGSMLFGQLTRIFTEILMLYNVEICRYNMVSGTIYIQ